MRATKYTVKLTFQFKKDYKSAVKRGLDIALLDTVITALAFGGKPARKVPRSRAVGKLARASGVSYSSGLAAYLSH